MEWGVGRADGGAFDNDLRPGRTVEEVDALGRRATATYDQRGQLTVSMDPGGRLFTTVYDASGARWKEYAPDGTSVERFYASAMRRYVHASREWKGPGLG